VKTSFTRQWVVAEAARQGLPMDAADAKAIFEWVATIKAELARARPEDVESLEPVYRLALPDPDKPR
jgi:hypothetical protein